MTERWGAVRAVMGCGLVAVALVSCSAPEDGPEVASLSTGTGQAPAASTERERPRERLDMTSEDLEALQRPYWKCMGEQGIPDKRAMGDLSVAPEGDERIAAAEAACAHTVPLPPWEKDPANPESHAFLVRVVDCLRGKGVVKVEVVPGESGGHTIAMGGAENDSEQVGLALGHMSECEAEASRR
ncbi:hypothetical protein KCV87_35465 [Actinosynnema pretiosum subsp. pretiosum]|uniref:Lipoprotein n=1 Tax=Actinosynnema pretiosum subsp. pretiosum TaxID=103721 RepID=A0AA45R444_9PSEU|nr:hypothetical protein APASM_4057 [Actinosynnema pretiosum subsp. pretiosum]QUF04532.1 hypothetical protein KCV87_35465 [Actinosynnema pretiosum subsp. pretiosum]